MRVDTVEFVMGAVGVDTAPDDGLAEIAFAGRSNVGKSSLINRLIQRKSLARTSSTPGKTQQLNYYRVNERVYFVDLPGYGFVHGGQDLRRSLGKLTDGYLHKRKQLRAVVQLIDARHGPSDLDLQLIETLRELSQPFLLVFTKIDKLTRGKLNQQMKRLEKEGRLADLDYLPFSSETGEGRSDLWRWIADTTSETSAANQVTKDGKNQ
ncbi:MAG: YihA family ribosome biogenesis GTP-binding protein [Gemmatimonadetes bacterium]|jgi:GTP-binding protein|nr:YihA family ribosome biogenesis GTP-binding protein [Gemmatimonadota bacterium]MBT5058381.1 YihA family ribosome biogenesis GTP-binding protein [Gemmatimonadota bacterium]MBT5146906.1 YihA family ribosome biogenesis GTP-binding protein [Gemmatimonadota bacterium]MBT5591181.1 YihA family ribosome biogenesis GTP-binding protein [Gemmatimonadota bacterium]MBT5960132.1 YihA family ribosome biogenesis GTP-binding protein [Gemmatimonadota bacterium]